MWDKDKGGDNLKNIKKFIIVELMVILVVVEVMFVIRLGCWGWVGVIMGGGGGGVVWVGGLK